MFCYGDDTLSVEKAWALAKRECEGNFSSEGLQRIRKSVAHIQSLTAQSAPIYGVNTGFGPLCNTIISKDQLTTLQYNLLRSHSVGVGSPLDRELVALMLVLKVQALSLGYSGISVKVLERLLWHVSTGYLPKVPSQGSLGASGDLAPLAHASLPLIGEGELWDGKKYVPAAKLLQAQGLAPLSLGPKEGLALINGTQFISAHAVYGILCMYDYLEYADLLAAMSIEGFLASSSPFLAEVHTLRPFLGAQHVATRMRLCLEGSEMMASHKNCARVQDPYCFRCVPQIHGASREAWQHLREQTEIEINAVTDNPLILDEKRVCSAGNFHGQLLALPIDYAAMAAAELGSVSEQRIYTLSYGGYNGLPKLLIENAGLHSGFMMPHYTAAALVSENKVLTHPASTDNVVSALGQENHVSLGAWAGRKYLTILENVIYILGIELFYAAQAMDFRRPMRSSKLLEDIHQIVRQEIPRVKEDRIFAEDIQKATNLLRSRKLLHLAQSRFHGATGLHKNFMLSTSEV